MNARIGLALIIACCLLCGCETYRYVFDTRVSDDGSVERTVTFTHEQTEQERAEAQKPDAEAPPNHGLPENLVVPDQARFDRFEWLDNGFTGTWRSTGRIETDFRTTVEAYTPRGTTLDAPLEHPGEPQQTRQAYNDGAVVVTDLVLVKAYTYIERFDDYYSRREFEKHGDIILDLLADVLLEALHKDLGEQYDFTALDELVRGTVLPLAKERKATIYAEIFVRQGLEQTLAESMPPDRLALMNDLTRCGVLGDPFADAESVFEACGEWAVATLHRAVKDRKVGEPWPVEEIRGYFRNDPKTAESRFMATATAIFAKRYASSDELAAPVTFDTEWRAMYQSFGATSDTHLFEVVMTAPGAVVYATPKPAVTLPIGGLTSVKWTFDERAFFPDGITLGLVTALPNEPAQTALLGRAALTDKARLERYVVLLQQLGERRDDVLAKLRESVKQQSLTPFAEYARGELGKDWNPDAEDQPPLGELLLILQGLAVEEGGV